MATDISFPLCQKTTFVRHTSGRATLRNGREQVVKSLSFPFFSPLPVLLSHNLHIVWQPPAARRTLRQTQSHQPHRKYHGQSAAAFWHSTEEPLVLYAVMHSLAWWVSLTDHWLTATITSPALTIARCCSFPNKAWWQTKMLTSKRHTMGLGNGVFVQNATSFKKVCVW